jgi:hypothetical protein
MSQPHRIQRSYTKGNLQLTILDLNSQQIQSSKRAATTYNVPRRTLINQRAGRRSQRDCEPNSKRLTKLEEKVIIQRVLKESSRGIPSSKADVRDMADKLLRERGSKAVSKN